MKIVEFINLFFLAAITGGWMMGTAIIVNAHKLLSAQGYVEDQQANTKFGCVYFPIVFGATVISQIIFLVLHGTESRRAFVMSLLSLTLVVTMAGFTAAKVLPINRIVKTWSPTHPPADWTSYRDRWRRYHRQRTAVMIMAFMLQSAVVIWR